MPVTLILFATLAATGLGLLRQGGLSLDGPLYACIARHVASGDLFVLKSGVPPFEVFHEHPHLYFWLAGIFVKIFGPIDASLRLLAMCCYAGTLVFSYRLLQHASRGSAFIVFLLLLMAMTNFGTWHMNAYIDPLMLMLAIASLDAALRGRATLCGVLGALVLMTKGLAALAVGPAILMALLMSAQGKQQSIVKTLLSSALACTAVLLAYALVLHFAAPTFLVDYWSAQGARSQGLWSSFGFLRFEFWRVLMIQTLAMFLCVLWLFKDRSSLGWAVMLWSLSFVLMLSGVWRVGAQYFLPLMWVAAMAGALALSARLAPIKLNSARAHRAFVLLFGIVFLLGQHPSVHRHSRTVPQDAPFLAKHAGEQGCSQVVSELKVKGVGALDADWIGELAPLVWYSGVDLTRGPSGPGQCVLSRRGQVPSRSEIGSAELKKIELSTLDLWVPNSSLN
jgi:4-amino-4-deoxy-L-arabinose transferase-like glycosyltransferase